MCLPPEEQNERPGLTEQQKERLHSACGSPSAAGDLLVPSLHFCCMVASGKRTTEELPLLRCPAVTLSGMAMGIHGQAIEPPKLRASNASARSLILTPPSGFALSAFSSSTDCVTVMGGSVYSIWLGSPSCFWC